MIFSSSLNVDLAPTILAAAGLTAPAFIQGRDIAQLYLNATEATKTWRKDFFYEWNQGFNPFTAEGHINFTTIPAVFALVRKDYKYFYWPDYRFEQVFNIQEDPFEEFDLWNTTIQTSSQTYKELVARYAYLKNLSQNGHPI